MASCVADQRELDTIWEADVWVGCVKVHYKPSYMRQSINSVTQQAFADNSLGHAGIWGMVLANNAFCNEFL